MSLGSVVAYFIMGWVVNCLLFSGLMGFVERFYCFKLAGGLCLVCNMLIVLVLALLVFLGFHFVSLFGVLGEGLFSVGGFPLGIYVWMFSCIQVGEGVMYLGQW